MTEETELDLVIEKVITARAAGMDAKEMFGGPRDWVDQMLPSFAFFVSYLIGGISLGIKAAIAVEAVLVLVRLVRRETLRHAFSGAFGVAISVLIVRVTHNASNYFLPGILINAAYAVAFFVSVLVRKPLVGIVMRFLSEKPKAWHDHPRVKRAYAEATIAWGMVSVVRVVVQEILRRHHLVGWQFVAKLALGYPLYIAALALTKPYIDRRTRGLEVPADPEAESGGEDAADDAAGRVAETDATGRGDDLDGVGGERRVGADEPGTQRRRGRLRQGQADQ